MADLNLIHNNPSDLFKYGISFNKIFDYLAAARPTFTTFPCKYNPAVLAGAGKAVDKQTYDSIADGIDSMVNNITDDLIYCNMARKAAINYDYKNLSDKLLHILESL